MPVDFSNYVDLRSFDPDPSSVYLDAVEYARLALPEFQPRQGTPEDALMQAFAYVSSLGISAINRLPNRLMSGILTLLGVERDEGERALLDVEFTALSYDGATIPSGLILRYDYEFLGNQNSIYFETIEQGIIDPVTYVPELPLPTTIVSTRAIEVGEIVPLISGVQLSIESPTSDIQTAVVNVLDSQGRNVETDTSYLNRGTTYISSLSSAFGKGTQVDSYVLSTFADISRCKTYDTTDSQGDLLYSDAAEPGYVTVFVYGLGAVATSDQKYDILSYVSDRAIAGLTISVEDVIIAEIEATISVICSADVDTAIMESRIKAILSSYISPSTSPFSTKLRESDLMTLVGSLDGVLYIESINISPMDANSTDGGTYLSFAKKGTVANLNSANITVTATIDTD